MIEKLTSAFLEKTQSRILQNQIIQRAHKGKVLIFLGVTEDTQDGITAFEQLSQLEHPFQLELFPEDKLVKKELTTYVSQLVKVNPIASFAATHYIIVTKSPEIMADGFAENCFILQNPEEGFGVRPVSGGTFGSPENVSTLFGEADGLSYSFLDEALRTDWSTKPKELKQLIDSIGSSFYRAELRAILKELNNK